jgi:hypothetical protein
MNLNDLKFNLMQNVSYSHTVTNIAILILPQRYFDLISFLISLCS